MKKILLSDMRDRLQARMNYDDPQRAFDALLAGWNKHRKANSASLSSFIKRGCMSEKTAHEFALYCGYPIDEDA